MQMARKALCGPASGFAADIMQTKTNLEHKKTIIKKLAAVIMLLAQSITNEVDVCSSYIPFFGKTIQSRKKKSSDLLKNINFQVASQ